MLINILTGGSPGEFKVVIYSKGAVLGGKMEDIYEGLDHTALVGVIQTELEKFTPQEGE